MNRNISRRITTALAATIAAAGNAPAPSASGAMDCQAVGHA